LKKQWLEKKIQLAFVEQYSDLYFFQIM